LKAGIIVVAATHDTSYQNDAGGIKASRRWLSEATPSGYEMGVKAAGTPAGAQAAYAALPSGGVVAETLLNHRLLAAMPQELSRSKSVINGREEYKRHIFFASLHPQLRRFHWVGYLSI